MAVDYSHTFAPHRGSKATMSNVSVAGKGGNLVLKAGELFVEYNQNVGDGAIKIKIGDGTTPYYLLPYAISGEASENTVEFTDSAQASIDAIVNDTTGDFRSGNTLAQLFGGARKAVKLLDEAIETLDGEVVKSITLDGKQFTTLTNNDLAVSSPDYTVVASNVDGSANTVNVTLTPENGYDKETSSVAIVGSGDVSVAVNTDGKIAIGYTHPTEGAVGTWNKNVQVDANGHVIDGESFEFDGQKVLVTDANGEIVESSITTSELNALDGVTSNIQEQLNALDENKSDVEHTHVAADIESVYVETLTAQTPGNTIAVSLIPQAALERLYEAKDEAAMRALTTAQVQTGDVVLNQDTQVMYFVKDDSVLPVGSDDTKFAQAFAVFKAGKAAGVDWNDITNANPDLFTNGAIGTPAGFTGAVVGTAGKVGFVPAPVAKAAGDDPMYLADDGSWKAFDFDFGDESI